MLDNVLEKEIFNVRRWLAVFLLFCLILGIVAQVGRLRFGEGRQLFDGDGFYYYVYLPNLFFKKNLDFAENYAKYQPQGPMWSRIIAETGRWSNVWSVGPALMWAPGFLLGHLAWLAARSFGRPQETDGFDLYHEGGAAFGGLVCALLAVLLCYRIAREVAPPRTAFWTTVILWLGTPLINYGFLEVDMSHGIGILVFSALIYTTLIAKKHPESLLAWFGCGALVGLAMLIRPQHFVLLLIPLGTWGLVLWEAKQEKKKLLPILRGLLLLLAAIPLFFLPQMLAWKAIFGHYLVVSQPDYFGPFRLTNLIGVLFSFDRGYFIYSPLWLLSLIGLLFVPKELRWLAVLVAAVWGVQVILSAWAADWAGGEAFGARRLTEIGAGLTLGLAALLLSFRSKSQEILIGGLLAFMVVLNSLLLIRYCFCAQ